MSLQTWECGRPNCQARNVAEHAHCTVCHAPRPSSFRSALAVRRVPPIDLEEFCRRLFARSDRRPTASLDEVDGEIFLTLTPHAGDPAIYRVDENAVIPCDNFGRPGW